MYGCESWSMKKAERQRIDGFELWCWRRLLRVPWTARRSNQSILKEISPGISLEGMMLKLSTLAISCEELTLWKRLWCWEGLGAGGEGDDRGWDGWMASRTWWTWVRVNSGSWWWTGRSGMLQFMGLQRVAHDWATELNWTEMNWVGKLVHGRYALDWVDKPGCEPWSSNSKSHLTIVSMVTYCTFKISELMSQTVNTINSKYLPLCSLSK